MVIISNPTDVALFLAIAVTWFWQPAPASYRTMRDFYKRHAYRTDRTPWFALPTPVHELGWPIWFALLVFAYFLYFQEMTNATSEHGYYPTQFALMIFGAFLLKWWPALVFYKHEYTVAFFTGLFAVFAAIVSAVLFGTDFDYKNSSLTRYIFSLVIVAVYAAWLAVNLISTMNWWNPLEDRFFIRMFGMGTSPDTDEDYGYGRAPYPPTEETMYGPRA